MAPPELVETRGHRRFVRFCEHVLDSACIGVCVGPAGVGKTVSARRQTRWDVLEPRYPRFSHTERPPPEVASVESVFYAPPVVCRPRLIAAEIEQRRNLVGWFAAVAKQDAGRGGEAHAPQHDPLPEEADAMRLLIVDEANWLKMPDLEQLRSMHDRDGFGLILLGMPGLEKALARYAQLYSRIGGVYRYAPLDDAETRDVVVNHAKKLGSALPDEAFSDEDGVAALVRESRGNFRLLQKLLDQCERLVRINGLDTVSARAVDAARKTLTFGEE